MPKERYRLYHAEKAKGGMALTMTAGSAIVSRDSPAAFGNLHAYRDEIVPWLARTRRCLPRARLQGDDPAHPSRPPHRLEQGRLAAGAVGLAGARAGASLLSEDRPRTGTSTASSPTMRAPPQRMQAAGLDGIEFEAYGHLLDGFWSPATNQRDDDYGGSLDNRLRFTWRVHRRGARRGRPGFHRRHPHGRRRGFRERPVEGRGRRDRAAAGGVRQSSISSTSSAARSRPTRR